MRWNRAALAAAVVAAMLLLRPAVHSADDKRLVVFAPQTSYSVSVTDREGRAYVQLNELIAPLGHPEVRLEGRSLHVRAGQVDAELRDGNSKLKLGRGELDLGGKVVLEGDRALVPLHSVPQLLSRVLGLSSDLHENARRLLIAGTAVHFVAEVKKGDTPTLVLTFTAPVNPAVSTEPGRLKLVFGRDPVVSNSESFKFDDATIPAATYSEGGGAAELEISGKAPLLATFSDGGKTIVITPAPGATAQTPPQPNPANSTPPSAEAPLPTQAGSVQPAPLTSGSPRTRYLVVIDPGHGGDDPGARFSDRLVEKEVTMAFARRLRSALGERGISAHLLRDGDSTVSNEQRAASANNLHASVFVTVHASAPGSGVRLYTSMLAEAEKSPAAFYPWETAQSFFLRPSRIVAQATVEELGKRKIGVLLMPANVRPMNNVAAAVIGVELATPSSDPERVTSGKYQDPIAAAVAQGIANARNALEGPQ